MKAERNPFPRPTGLEKVLLKELVRCAKACYDRGWSHGTAGNFSLRGKDGIVWQSPSGLNKGELNPDHFIPIETLTANVIWPMKVQPSAEMPMHVGIYRAVADAMAVVHTHPPALVELSRPGKDLVFKGEEMQKHLGAKDHDDTLKIPVIKNPLLKDMLRMIEGVAEYVNPKVPMVVLASHGVYAWGKTPMEALSLLEAAEFLCRTHLTGR